MSVTYGAGGGTSKYTLEIAKNIKEAYGVPTLAHLTCVSSTKETVLEKIEAMKDAGIENVMALRGDLTPELEKSTALPSGDEIKRMARTVSQLKADGRIHSSLGYGEKCCA